MKQKFAYKNKIKKWITQLLQVVLQHPNLIAEA
jgi:hypothetical protein